MGLEAALLNQVLTFFAQLGYLYAFRGAFERQEKTLRARFWASLGLGFALCLAWLGMGYAAFFLAAVQKSAAMLALLSVPLYLAIAAGGAVSLTALSGRLFGWSVEEHPFRCLFVGQVFAVAAGAVPWAGPVLVSLYACSGIGAIAVSEMTARPDDEETPRLGMAGLASMLVLSAALALGLWRANKNLKAEAAQEAPAAAAADWSSSAPK